MASPNGDAKVGFGYDRDLKGKVERNVEERVCFRPAHKASIRERPFCYIRRLEDMIRAEVGQERKTTSQPISTRHLNIRRMKRHFRVLLMVGFLLPLTDGM